MAWSTRKFKLSGRRLGTIGGIVWCLFCGSLAAQSSNSSQASQAASPKKLIPGVAFPRQRSARAFEGLTDSEPVRKTGKTSDSASLPPASTANAAFASAATNQLGMPGKLPTFETAAAPSRNASAQSAVTFAPSGASFSLSDFTSEAVGPMNLRQHVVLSDQQAEGEESGDSDDTAVDSDEEESGAEEEEAEETFFRPEFHELGPLTLESIYTGEVFNNAHGGISTKSATRYRGNFDLTLMLDFEKARLWSGGEIFVYFHQSHGTTLTPDFVGDGQYYSNIDTGPRPQQLSRLGEYWFRQTSPDETTAFKIGRQDANADFAFCDLSSDFLNSSFVTIPNIPMPFWPFQSLGVSGISQVNDRLKVGGGVYDQSQNIGQWWTTSSDQGVFTICQADWSPFAEVEDAKLTLLRFGSWYTSADTEGIGESGTYSGNYGVYATVDRILFAETNADDQGLGSFFQFSWAPEDRNDVDRAFAAGLIYRGLLSNRDQDTCGIAYTGIMFSELLKAETGQTSEDVMELFYKARLRRGISLQPDLQYIARPYGQERDALVVGFRFESNF